ncbi:MAG: type VI secretion system baseplate subunit TssE [Holosporales bacterium]|nr:type VI secretion system baseplate subunit TssE [Holosporales bacterium]
MSPFKTKPHAIKENIFLPPFFDRLSLNGTNFLDEEGIKESVKEELSRLLNTRLGHGRVQMEEAFTREEDGITTYLLPDLFGIEDFSSFSVENSEWSSLERQIEKACSAYEPRLKKTKITILKDTVEVGKLFISLSGDLLLGERTIHLSFPLVIEGFDSSETSSHTP